MIDNNDDTQGDAPQPKRPYEPPAVVAEHTFESLALTCARVNDADVGCIGANLS